MQYCATFDVIRILLSKAWHSKILPLFDGYLRNDESFLKTGRIRRQVTYTAVISTYHRVTVVPIVILEA